MDKKLFSLKGLYSLTNNSIEWGVLGISRLYYGLIKKDIVSKDNVVPFIMDYIPAKYHRILREAEIIRKYSRGKYYSSLFNRRKDMIEYIGYVIDKCLMIT